MLAGYRVYRDGTLIATTTSTSYTDSDSAVVPGTYVYSVVAFDGAGNTTSSVAAHRDRRHDRTDDAGVGHARRSPTERHVP